MGVPCITAPFDIFELSGQCLKGLVQFTGCGAVQVAQHMVHLLGGRLNLTDLPLGVREFLTQSLQVCLIARCGSLGDCRFQLQGILSKLLENLLRLLSVDKKVNGRFGS